MKFYVWCDSDCENATEDLEEARRWEKEFLDEGRDAYIVDIDNIVVDETYNNSMRLLRPDKAIHVGLVVVTLLGEEDLDSEGNERFTDPGSIGRIVDLNNNDVWDLVFDFNGAWVCPTEAELRDSTQYTLYVKET
jgi:hypothetical protein